MASPDTTPYVDLTLFDLDVQQIFEAALVNLQAYLPDWEPREGHTEVMLLESMALQVAEAVFALNRVPGAVVEVLLRLYGIDRDLGSPPTVPVRFTAVDTAGYTIPAGTRVSVPIGDDSAVVFALDAPLAIPAGSTEAAGLATADTNTTVANGLPASTYAELLDAVSTVERIALDGPIGGGADPEEDAVWFERGIQRFSRLTETLVLPRHFVAAALERPEVSRAYAVDAYDANQGGSPGDHPGHITVAVYGDGAPLTAPQKATIAAIFDAQAQANLAIHMADPTISPVNVNATVVALPGYTNSQVETAVEAALTSYLSPVTWEWSAVVYRNELIALLDRVEGVDRVVSITTPAADLALTGVAPLASPGALTITVTGG